MRYPRPPFVLLLVCVLQNISVAQDDAPLEYSFERFQEDFEVFGGRWSTANGTLSASGGPAKAVLRNVQHADFELTVELRAKHGTQAGVMFRVSEPTAAIDGFQGYYLGIHSGSDQLLWGAIDGSWHEIARRPTKVAADTWHRLRLVVHANHVQAWIDQIPVAAGSFPKFDGVDHRFSAGRIGLRMLGTGAEFRKLTIRDIASSIATNSTDATYTNPVQASCADPCVLRHDGTYYAYCTYSRDYPDMPRGIRLYTSKNLKDWTDEGFVIRKEQSWGESRFWAPDIIEREGMFYLYYAADVRICVAKAKSPRGPFTQIGNLPMEPDSIRIDAHVFRDDDGRYYFYYVHFNRGNEIWGGELNDDMVTVRPESLRLMVRADQPWEQHQAHIAEGPAMLKRDGTYYLTYSGSHFEHPNYAVGYATSDSPLGPWKKYAFNPIMKSTAYAHGTAHHCFTTSPDGRETIIVYHRHFRLNRTEPRAMSIDRVRFVPQDGGPAALEIWGPTSSPQPLPSGARPDPDRPTSVVPTDKPVNDERTAGPLPVTHFVNPIAEGADPWVTRDPETGRYLWCMSDGNRAIALHAGENLSVLGPKQIVWKAPETGPFSREVWAPELHFLDKHWYIYFAADDGQNRNHLAYVLKSASSDLFSKYTIHGPFQTGDTLDENRWAIDMTVFEHGSKRYAIWSGWDTATSDRQYLYIAEMESPTKLATLRTRICSNDNFAWEFTEGDGKGRGLNEGAQVLKSGDRTFLTYSCGGSWLPTYRLGMLELVGDDPLNPKAWKKFEQPVFTGTNDTFGVGHSCFVTSTDGSEHWHVFHAKRDRRPGWRRAIFMQPFQFRNGAPHFGQPVKSGVPIPRPSGEDPAAVLELPYRSDLKTDHSYYGHHQFYEQTANGIRLGEPPTHPVNDYRSGEKILLNRRVPNDFTASVSIDFHGNAQSHDAGLLLRTTAPSVGFDAHRGYFVGIKPSENAVLLGRMDGRSWKELQRAPVAIDTTTRINLRVNMSGPRIEVSLNHRQLLIHNDTTFPRGTVGLRVVNTTATFSNLRIEAN